jgi:hypothetical protein
MFAAAGVSASAAPSSATFGAVKSTIAVIDRQVEPAHYRGRHHCHWRHGHRHCHDRYARAYGNDRYWVSYAYQSYYPYPYGLYPGVHLHLGHHFSGHHHGGHHGGHHGHH